MSGITTILIALLVFAAMVLVHEFGHFATAKLFKIRVVEFAVGMGPAIFKKKRGETTYALRCIPIGGYCMFEDDIGNADSENSFQNAAWYKRLCVALAGAFLNIVLGLVAFVILQSATPQSYTPKITALVPDMAMESSAFEVGDEIIRLNNTRIHIKEDISLFMEFNGDKPVKVTAKRGDRIIEDTIAPTKVEYRIFYGENEITVRTLTNGVQTDKQTEPAPKDDANYTQSIGESDVVTQYMLGFEGTLEPSTFKTVLRDACYKTIFSVKSVYLSLGMMLRGQVRSEQISGPIGVVSLIDQATEQGWLSLIYLIGLLTVNLGIMNLLPIPGLDGCKSIIIVAEGITRKKLPQKVETAITLVGFALLILLMLFATFNDINNIFIRK